MTNVERLLVTASALGVLDGTVSLAEAAAGLSRAQLGPEDIASVREVSGLIRQLLASDPSSALVFATLNDVVARRCGDTDLRALASFDLANAYAEEGRLAEALPILDELHRDLRDRDVRGVPYDAVAGNRAVIRSQLGDVEEGIAEIEEMIVRSENSGRPADAGRWRLNLAAIYERLERWDEAQALYGRAADDIKAALAGGSAENRPDRDLERLLLAASLGGGRVAQRHGEDEEAVERLRPAADLSLSLNDPAAAYETLTVLARSLVGLGETERAVHALAMSIDIHTETGAGEEPEWATQTLVGLLRSLGRAPEAIVQLERFAARAGQFDRYMLQASFSAELAALCAAEGDNDRAETEFGRASEIFERVSAYDAARHTVNEIARLRADGGDIDGAMDQLRRGLVLAERAADHRDVYEQTMLIAALLSHAGRHDEADAALAEALTVAEATGDLQLQVEALVSIGQRHIGAQRVREAVDTLWRAAALAQAVGDPAGSARVDALLGAALLWIGDLVAAAARLERAVDGFVAVGDRADEAISRSNLATAYAGLGRGEHAVEQARIALAIGRELDELAIIAEASAALGQAYELQGRPAEALHGYTEASDIAQALDRSDLSARYLEGKANALTALARVDEARRVYDEALVACRRSGDTDREASVTTNVAVLDLLAGRSDEAVAGLTWAIDEARRLGNDWLLTIALTHLADAHQRTGRNELARGALEEARQIAERRGYPEHLWRQAIMRTRLLDGADGATGTAARAEAIDMIQRLSDMPGAGRREDMLRYLAAFVREFEESTDDERESLRPLLNRVVRRLSAEYLTDEGSAASVPEEPVDAAEWVSYARRFVATGDLGFVRRAIEACDDESVRHVLEQLEEHEGDVPQPLWEPVVRNLEVSGAESEALSLNLVAAYPLLQAAAQPSPSAELDRAALTACRDALAAAMARGWRECEAAFALTLGARAVAEDRTDEGLAYLFTSAGLFRRLAATEPDVYRHRFVAVLNRLGSLYASTGDGAPARAMYRRAIAVLTPDAGEIAHDDAAHLLPVLHNLAQLQLDEHDTVGAAQTLKTASAYHDSIPVTLREAYAPTRIALLQATARLNFLRRQPAAARNLNEQTIALTRTIMQRSGAMPSAELAYPLNLLGATIAAEGDSAAALPVFEASLRFARSGAPVGEGRRNLISTLMNLAGAAADEGLQDRALAAYQEAIDLQRPLAEAQPDIHEARLVDLLTNLGTTQLNGGDPPAALESLQEAVDRGRRLHRSRPDSSRLIVVAALDRLASAQASTGAEASADATATEAVRLAEQPRTRTDAWLWKGWAVNSYHRLLARAIATGDEAGAHAYLAALREPTVGATEMRPEESMTAARATLAKVAAAGGPDLRIVIAERLSNVDVLGVLDTGGMRLHMTGTVAAPAHALFDAVLSVFDAADDEGYIDPESLAAVAETAMGTLPDAVRDTLVDASATVLISGDPYWSTFPWEALCYGSGQQRRWLGLERPLPRAPGLTASAFDPLLPDRATAGRTDRTAAVVGPWDAVAEQPLEEARAEAVQVASLLQRHGRTLVPDGMPLLGAQADTEGLLRALASRPAVIHYTGHADVVAGEEVLLLAGADGVEQPFGYADLMRLRGDGPARPLLAQAPIVVLNACHAGHSRAFGGRREDLLSTFLAEGAACVVASAFPVDEVVGAIVGTSLYEGPDGEDVGSAVVRVRRALADGNDPLARTLWTLITCHGNHLSRMP